VTRTSGRPRLSPRLVPLAAAGFLLVPLAGVSAALTAPELPLLPESDTAPVEEETTPDSRVVVAVVDSATNPYHEFFDVGGDSTVTPDVLAEFGIDDRQTISLTRTGDFSADYAADRAQWDAVEIGKPYWFEGTNVIGISFDPSTSRPILPDDERDTHGVGTTAAVLAANPEAVTVLVEGVNADSESWAFTHPAVDIVSTSYGFPGSLPVPFHLENSHSGVVELGKLHAGAADNSPALSPPDGTSGPWWSIGVAGYAEGTSEGRELLSGNLVDVVGDFTQDLPYCAECTSGTRSVSGTSFATPRVAGTLSAVLLEARRGAGHLGGIDPGGDAPRLVGGSLPTTNWELRRAMEEGAYYPGLAGYDPESAVFDDLTAAPVLDPAPWLQTGWGAVTPDPEHGVVAETLAHLGVGGEPTRFKSAEACAFNNAGISARHAYWDSVAVGSESFGSSEDPYLYC
jgi:hypothetical protein